MPLTIILVGTQLPENLGSVARVMCNFGLQHLRLVAPLIAKNHPKALATAVHAKCVLENALLYDCLENAIEDCHYVYATTGTERDLIHHYVAPQTLEKDDTSHVAIVFGRESTGLTNEELRFCQKILSIPVSPEYSSLNLSHAVGIVAYEWFIKKRSCVDYIHLGDTHPALQKDVHFFLENLETHLDRVDFWRVPSKKPAMRRNLWNAFNRMQLTDQELRTFRGIVTALVK